MAPVPGHRGLGSLDIDNASIGLLGALPLENKVVLEEVRLDEGVGYAARILKHVTNVPGQDNINRSSQEALAATKDCGYRHQIYKVVTLMICWVMLYDGVTDPYFYPLQISSPSPQLPSCSGPG